MNSTLPKPKGFFSSRKDEAKKAIVLLSGGLDSTTALFWAKRKGYRCLCLIFNYAQRHKKEIEQARLIAKRAGFKHKLIKIDFPKKSSLTNKKISLPNKGVIKGIPVTYVSARNIIFLSFATAFAESEKINTIIIGTNQIDYSNYPDCRIGFLKAFEYAINKGTKSGITGRPFRVMSPLQNKTKAQIIRLAKRLNVPLELTWSCYAGGKRPCRKCPSCRIRAKGFKQAGIEDPILNI